MVSAGRPVGAGSVTAAGRRERWAAWVLLLGAALIGGALRVHLALTEDGIFWPDEVYQSLEPAHRLVYGYGFTAWEFIEGARNWTFPALIAGILEVCRALGLDAPRQYLTAVRLAMVALAMVSIWGVYQLALSLGAARLAAALGAGAFALAAPAIYFSFRANAEVASTALVLFGIAWAGREGAGRRALIAGASLLGIAVLFRLQNAFYCIVLLGMLGHRREWRAAGLVTAVLGGWAVVLGAIDLFTWGSWFHSALTYLRFNSSPRVALLFGSSPPAYYLRNLLHSLGALAPPLGLLALLSARRAPVLLVGTIAIVVIYSLVPHKELRFIYPVIALAAALAAVGLDWLVARVGSRWGGVAAGALLAGAVGGVIALPSVTFGDLGQYGVGRGEVSAYGYGASVNRLLMAAHDRPDLCGLRLDGTGIVRTLGYAGLHRAVPLYSTPGPAAESGYFNYAIVAAGAPHEGTMVARDGAVDLLRLDRSSCVPDPGFGYTFEGDPLQG